MPWIDAHCHLTDPSYQDKWNTLLADSRKAGIDRWIQGGIEPAEWQRQMELAREYLGVVPIFGLHPWWVGKATDEQLARGLYELEKALPEAAGLGETGLDFHPKRDLGRPLQIQAFEAQLAMAARLSKPLVLHIVEAHSEALRILSRQSGALRGIVHSFSGPGELARDYIAKGLLISVGSGVLKSGYANLKKALKDIPPEKTVVETDCPSGASGPKGLLEIARAVGFFQNRSLESVLDQSTQNLEILFRMK